MMEQIPSQNNEEKRSGQQNKALHKWLTLIANQLRERGLTMRQVQKAMEEYDTPVTMEQLKYDVWHKIQFALFRTQSTTELLKSQRQIDDIVDVMCPIFGKMGVVLPPFPSIEKLNLEQTYDNRAKRSS